MEWELRCSRHLHGKLRGRTIEVRCHQCSRATGKDVFHVWNLDCDLGEEGRAEAEHAQAKSEEAAACAVNAYPAAITELELTQRRTRGVVTSRREVPRSMVCRG